MQSDTVPGTDRLEDELKRVIVADLDVKGVDPAAIGDDDPLFVEGLGLDSLDAVELTVLLKRRYGVEFANRNEARDIMVSIRTLANYVRGTRTRPPSATPAVPAPQ